MGPAVLLKQLLRSLCYHDTRWKYAVFWKLKHQSHLLLTWEDGYCKPAVSAGNTVPSEFFGGTSRIISFGCEMDAPSGHSAGCSIEQAITNMSSHSYISGEGIVGHAAFTGDHFWAFGNSRSLHEYPEEWQFQIAAGIKTILLVPVQHGVVQLGSLEMVEENLATVAHISQLFASLQDTTDSCAQFVSSGNIITTPRSRSASLVANGSLPTQLQPQPPRKKHRLGLDVEHVTKKEQSDIGFLLSSPYIIQDSLPFSQVDMQHILGISLELPVQETSWSPTHDPISVVPTQDLHILNPCYGTDNSLLIECQSSSFAPESILLAPSHHNADDQILFTEQSTFVNTYKTELQHSKYDSCGVGDEMGWPFLTETSDITFHDSNSSMLNFFPDSKLHEASGLPFPNDISDCLWSSVSCDNGLGSSMAACQTGEDNNVRPLFADFSDFLMDENEEKHLLDAVVYNPHYSSDETPQNLSSCTRSSSNSSGNLVGSCVTQSKPETDVLEADHLDSHNHIKSRFASSDKALTSSPTRSPSKSVNLLTDEVKHTKAPRSGSNNVKKSSHVGKKKPKAGDAHKPRPRDRQLIQDRVKELRVLVPHGEKCSIDALLDRAIKHMLFLRSVSSQAEKLKHCAHPKVSEENRASSEPQNSHNGATWAIELGGKPEICPILVENLEQPGQMLVEMLCTEYGDFLEIAHVIRQSELVILKGVMESRSDKLWSRFIVEASRGFDRMDILWPLMRLMQQTCGPFTTRF